MRKQFYLGELETFLLTREKRISLNNCSNNLRRYIRQRQVRY